VISRVNPNMISRIPPVIFMVVIILVTAGHAAGQQASDDPDPVNMPDFLELDPPQIPPGGSGTISFTLKNRFASTIQDIELEMELFRFVELEQEGVNISTVQHSPVFEMDSEHTIVLTIDSMTGGVSSEEIPLKADIITHSDTPVGTYRIRTRMSFLFEGDTSRTSIKSMGFFTDEQWALFSSDGTLPDDSHGILTETAIGVWWVVPREPYYILIAAAVIVASGGFYYHWIDRTR